METIEINRYTSRFRTSGANQPLERTRATSSLPWKRLVWLLGSGLAVIAGPSILETIGGASFVSIQLLLETCHAGLVAYQIFGC